MTPQRPSTIPAPSTAHYPRWMYHQDLPNRVVNTPEEEKLLKNSGWVRTPFPPKAVPAEVDPIEEMRATIAGLSKALAALSHDLSEAVAEFRKERKGGK